MKLLLILILSYSFPTYSSVPELFGASAGALAIGNQAEKGSAANNYYAASLLGFSETTKFNFTTYYINTDFTSIKNVTVRNFSSGSEEVQPGNVEVNTTPTLMFGAHLSTPLFSESGPKFNFSVFAPFDRLLEANSGDPYYPSYAMYGSRFIRPIIMFSGAQSFNDWSFSAGAQTSFQSNGETHTLFTTSEGSPSLGRINFNAKPSLAFNASIAKQWKSGASYLSFHQEMRSRLENRATGSTNIAEAIAAFDFKMSTLLFYDPMTLRIGHQFFWEEATLFLSLEYQHWKTYEASTLQIQSLGGPINGSQDFEEIRLKNIFIPKVGIQKALNDKWDYKLGYFFRKSPLSTSGLSGAGNTIDVDKHVASIGTAYRFLFMDKIITMDLAYQSHFLKSETIVKTTGQEDGSSGLKIGSPGYDIGGMIHVLSLGLSWML